MKRPNITPGPWAQNVDTAFLGDAFHAVCHPLHHPQSVANCQAIAALPDLLAALEGLLQDKYLADPINADRMKPAREALTKAGYAF